MTPTRDMPASEDAERHVLACCLLDPGVIDRCATAGIEPESFYYPRHNLVFTTLAGLRAAHEPATMEAVVTKLVGHRSPEDLSAIMALEDPTRIPTTAHAGYFIEQVATLAQKRRLIRDATDLVEHAYNGSTIPELSELAERLRPAPSTGNKSEKIKSLLSRRVSAASPPKEPITRLYLAEKPIATPGNLQTMTAKSKAGKTAATGATIAAIISASTGTSVLHDTFKFRASNPQGHAVIVIDTEQSQYDAWTCYDRSLKRAGTEQDPPWLLHFALVGYSVQRRKEALSTALEYAKETFGGVFLVILDGVAHFVSSVNELEECNALADWLRELTVVYDTAMLCVIHSNEGLKTGDDSRGHLGKQLMRDAESNLLLKKVGEITTITSEKQRKAPITEADQVAFQWSDEAGRHVSCKPVEPSRSRGGRTRLHTIGEFIEVIPKKGQPGKTGSQLHRMANDLKEIKLQTFKDLLADAVKDGALTRTYDDRTGFAYSQTI